MAKCTECGTSFEIDQERTQFDEEFEGDFDYDEETEGEQCANCAGARISSDVNLGRAIMMMNGDEDYDQNHVETYL